LTKEESQYLSIGTELKEAERSQMFGKPCFKIDGNAFISLFQNEMVFKLEGDMHKNALSLKGSHLFDPSGKGRPMKEWVQIPYVHEGQWASFAQASYDYVKSSDK
jgi:hypothetical protein